MDEVVRPFRWDLRRRSELGALADVDPPETYPEFDDDLLTCCARTLGLAGDGDLVFVGRSPQPLFDLLSGLLADTTWRDRLRLLNVALRHRWPTRAQREAIHPYFAQVGLDPLSLAGPSRSVTLVDVVDTGGTLGEVFAILESWAEAERADWRAIARKLRVVGLTWRTKTSPKTRRWQQHAEWVPRAGPAAIKNVSLPGRLATYLADEAPKTSYSFPPERWGDSSVATPARHAEAQAGLALAVRLFDLGREAGTRDRFVRLLVDEPAMSERWFRSLALELRD